MQRIALKKLTNWKQSEKRKPLMLLGARQVGKTHLLKRFGEEQFKKTHIFDFEADKQLSQIFEQDLDPQRIINALSLYSKVPISLEEDLLIFDEIQACGPALTSLKYFSEKMPKLHIASAGSLLGLMLNENSFPVGKVNFQYLAPLNFSEFVLARGEEALKQEIENCFAENRPLSVAAHLRLLQTLRTYILTGGLPEVVSACIPQEPLAIKQVQAIREIQRELVTTYLADMAKHCGKINAMHLERLWRNVPEQLARGIDGHSTKFTFKDVIPGIKGYERLAGTLDWLQKARLIIKVPIIDHAALPLRAYSHENTFKLYLFDVGLLTSMIQLDPFSILNNELDSFKGYLFENFVAQELHTTIQNQVFCWREKQSEVDFIIQDGQNFLPIEVKAGQNTTSRSLSVFRKKYSPPSYAVLSANNLAKHQLEAFHYPLYLASRVIKEPS